MDCYRIPVTETSNGTITVEANSSEEAHFNEERAYLEGSVDCPGLSALSCSTKELSKEGKTVVSKFNFADYVLEYCSNCERESVIFAKGITACPNCGAPLVPCSSCDVCDTANCPYNCFLDEEVVNEDLTVTNPPISEEEQAWYRAAKIVNIIFNE